MPQDLIFSTAGLQIMQLVCCQAQYFPHCIDRDDCFLTDLAQWPAVPSEYTSHSPPAGSKQLWDPCQPPCCEPDMIMSYACV